MDSKTERYQERVQGTLAAWKTDAEKLRAATDEMFRYHNGNLVLLDALSKCTRCIDEAISRLDSAALVLCILGLANTQENTNGTQAIR